MIGHTNKETNRNNNFIFKLGFKGASLPSSFSIVNIFSSYTLLNKNKIFAVLSNKLRGLSKFSRI